MGTVHKFKRPPKNEQQFRGYKPSTQGQKPQGSRRMADWQKSVLAWIGLILLAIAFWAGSTFFGGS